MATNNLNTQPDNVMKIGVRSLIQGRRGPEGQSAYDIYVEVQVAAGLPVLSKEDWLASLKGENSYDDGPINDTLAALSSRVTAIEDQGPPQGYDDTDIRQSLGALSQEVANIETYDDAAIQARLGQVESGVGAIPAISQEVDAIAAATADLSQQVATLASTVAGLPAPYDDTALEQRVATVETAPRTTQFVVEDGHLVLIQSDGSKIIGPPTDGDPTPGVAPQLTGGSLTQDNSDLVISPPAVTDGYPTPTLTMTLTRDGVDVTNEVTSGRIPNATPGEYVATWTATNGTAPDATATDSLTVAESGTVPVDLTVSETDGVLTFDGDGNITVEITDPTEYAGVYTQDVSVEGVGQLLNIQNIENIAPAFVVAPVIQRTAGPGDPEDHFVGTVYEFQPPLILFASGLAYTITHEWYEGGTATGDTDASYTRQTDGDVNVLMRIEVAGQAARTSWATPVSGTVATTVSTFGGVPDGTTMANLSDPAGRQWTDTPSYPIASYSSDDGDPATPERGFLRSTSDANFDTFSYAENDTGATEASVGVEMPAASVLTGPSYGGVALHAQFASGGNDQPEAQFYFLTIRLRDGHVRFGRKDSGSSNAITLFKQEYVAGVFDQVVNLSLRTEGDDVVALINGSVWNRTSDTTIRGGHPGVSMNNRPGSAEMKLPYGVFEFTSNGTVA